MTNEIPEMTLLDWFAGQALAAIIQTSDKTIDTYKTVADESYLQAEEMIKRRKGSSNVPFFRGPVLDRPCVEMQNRNFVGLCQGELIILSPTGDVLASVELPDKVKDAGALSVRATLDNDIIVYNSLTFKEFTFRNWSWM